MNTAAAKMKLVASRLTERGVIHMKGSGTRKFLQGMMTNDVTKLNSDGDRCLYTLFLQPKGRVISDAFLCPINSRPGEGDEDECFFDCDKNSIDILLRHFKVVFSSVWYHQLFRNYVKSASIYNPYLSVYRNSNCDPSSLLQMLAPIMMSFLSSTISNHSSHHFKKLMQVMIVILISEKML